MTARASMPERLTLYIPPEVRTRFLVSGLPIEEARVVKVVTQGEKLQNKEEVAQQEPIQSGASEAQDDKQVYNTVDFGTNKEGDTDDEIADEIPAVGDEVIEKEVDGEILANERSLEIEEEDGESLGGSAEEEGPTGFPVSSIR